MSNRKLRMARNLRNRRRHALRLIRRARVPAGFAVGYPSVNRENRLQVVVYSGGRTAVVFSTINRWKGFERRAQALVDQAVEVARSFDAHG